MPIRRAAGRSEYPVVVTDENPPAGIDVSRPSVARVYDYWLGGKDNFASDREMGRRMAEVNPAMPQLVRHNREFICAAAARAAAAWLIVSSGHYEDKELAGRLQQTATHTRFWNHYATDLASMLAGLETVAPGVCEARRWIAGTGGEPTGKKVYALAGVGVKSL